MPSMEQEVQVEADTNANTKGVRSLIEVVVFEEVNISKTTADRIV